MEDHKEVDVGLVHFKLRCIKSCAKPLLTPTASNWSIAVYLGIIETEVIELLNLIEHE